MDDQTNDRVSGENDTPESGDHPAEPEFVTVATLDEIPAGEGRAFEVGDNVIAVFNDNGNLHAIDDMCPHMGASLATGHFDGENVTCPWHAWRFSTRDGSWCDNRRLKIPVFRVRVTDGGDVQVSVNPDTSANDIQQRAGKETDSESDPEKS